MRLAFAVTRMTQASDDNAKPIGMIGLGLLSIFFYSAFAGLGAFVTTCEQMLALRFLVGLGVGGM